MTRWFALLAALLLATPAHAQSLPAQQAQSLTETVQTTLGTLHGNARDARGVLTFRGIPYAAPPVGELRWQPPQPAAAWAGTRDASHVGNRCWVNVPNSAIGGHVEEVPQNEDCLYLNVATGAVSADEHRPVMVWIHGGGFQFGTSIDPRTDPANLAQAGVVAVSMNYRLGVYGFFAHPKLRQDGALSGNFGIQDQIAALRWVKANIAAFGGDPENVTVFGESSGSQGVSLLMASPLAKGLFQRATGESGSSLQELPTLMNIALRGAAFAGALGAHSIEALRAIPAARINAAAAWDFTGGEPMIFAPGIDGTVIPAQLTEIFQAGRQNDVSLLAGYNKREDFPFAAERLPHRNAAEFRAAAQRAFGAGRMQAFDALYPSGSDADVTNSANAELGDIRQRAETWRWLTLQARTGKGSVYGYSFSFESAYSPVASHVAEIPYVFGDFAPQFFAPHAPPAGPEDHALSKTLMTYWVNFARSGNPNGPGLPTWPAFRDGHALLQIQENGQITANPPSDLQLKRFEFLDPYLIAASSGQE
jgi:para-nitrobenzyl esterase